MDEKILYRLVGAKIREIREKRVKTQEELANALGASRASVANYEAGKQAVYLSDLYRIADFLKVNIVELLPKMEEVRKRSDPGLLLEGAKGLGADEKKEIMSFIDEVSEGGRHEGEG